MFKTAPKQGEYRLLYWEVSQASQMRHLKIFNKVGASCLKYTILLFRKGLGSVSLMTTSLQVYQVIMQSPLYLPYLKWQWRRHSKCGHTFERVFRCSIIHHRKLQLLTETQLTLSLIHVSVLLFIQRVNNIRAYSPKLLLMLQLLTSACISVASFL